MNDPSKDLKVLYRPDGQLSAYFDKTAIRALVQAIPYVGGSIDTLFAGRGSKLRDQHLLEFLKLLDDRLKTVEVTKAPEPDAEALEDLLIRTMEDSVRTRSTEKRKRFADLIAKQITGWAWEEKLLLSPDRRGGNTHSAHAPSSTRASVNPS